MKSFAMFRKKGLSLTVLVFAALLFGCQKDGVYDPSGDPLPPSGDFFDFTTAGKVSVNLNYHIPGYKVLFEIYSDNPLVYADGQRTKKEGITPLFQAYTDDNCTYKGSIVLPTAVKTVYLYSAYMFAPECVEIAVENGKIVFPVPETSSVPNARASGGDYVTDGYAFPVNGNLFSLCSWQNHGELPRGYVKEIVSGGSLYKRLQAVLKDKFGQKKDNSPLLSDEKRTNISISSRSADGEKIESARIDFVYLSERAGYRSTLGYYYYKTQDLQDGKINIGQLPKYIIFPNVSQSEDDPYRWRGRYPSHNAPLEMGMKVSLKYFGENYDKPATDRFPAGYSIGWFLLPDAYTDGNKINANVPVYYSNQSANADRNSRCITIYDRSTEKMVIGFEDGIGKHDKSYDDILFYVEADPVKAIVDPENPGVPSIDGDQEITLPDRVNAAEGTLAFEDIWPSGGDYDLNDVVVEYKTEITFNSKNQILKIVDTFRPVHDGATYKNAFGYQLPEETVNSAKVTLGTGIGRENGQNHPTYLIFENAKEAVAGQKSYTVTREFATPLDFYGIDAATLVSLYNPFIVPNYREGDRNRVEVHLPKREATDFADKSLIGTKNEAYYLDRDGAYPFAIQIPIVGFQVVSEKVSIDREYPNFRIWADSWGEKDTDWYLHYQGK